MAYLKPQSPIQIKDGDYIYPLTTIDQVIDTDGNTRMSVAWETFKQSVLDSIYPVGSIYMSITSTDPSTMFGGTWEQIQGRFLIGQNTTYTAGSTGGAATVALTARQMPKHGHNIYAWDSNNSNYDAYHWTSNGTTATKATSGGKVGVTWNSAAFKTAGNSGMGNTRYGSGDPIGVTDQSGAGTAHNNMPPYLAVYIWKRTA